MEVTISARHLVLEDELKEKASSLGNRFAADYPNQKVSSVRIHFSAERNWQVVEVLVNAKSLSLHAAAKANAAQAALAAAFEKVATQMERYLQKVRAASVKPDPVAKEKIWRSTDLKENGDDLDLEGYVYEYSEQ